MLDLCRPQDRRFKIGREAVYQQQQIRGLGLHLAAQFIEDRDASKNRPREIIRLGAEVLFRSDFDPRQEVGAARLRRRFNLGTPEAQIYPDSPEIRKTSCQPAARRFCSAHDPRWVP